MAYEPLHHKYRPQTFAQLVGQGAIAQTLTNAIASGRIAPAYLFSGPRGTGKTSSSRILAKSLNCIASPHPTPHPCGQCQVCREITQGNAMDIIEIDAASNTGVDNIRELIESAQFAPVQCRYKVYVIDECHMLSVAAFNALLKTLEEPPDRVVFVLATTDPQRVLNTIISRCQRFDFRRIPLDAMVQHLRAIAKQEEIAIAPEAVTLIAQIANGGLRDAESLLDQLSLLDEVITPAKVWDLVGAVPEQELLTLIQTIRRDDPKATLAQCRAMLDRGREPLIVLQNLAAFLLNLLIAKTAPQSHELVAVTAPTWAALGEEATAWELSTILQSQQKLKDSESQLRHTTQPRLWLEVTLLGLLPSALVPTPAVEPAARHSFSRTSPPRTPQARSPQAQVSPQAPSPPPAATPSAPPPPPQPTTPGNAADRLQQRIRDSWDRVLQAIEPFSTRTLVQQKCTLIDFDTEDSVAIIGVTSAPLLKLAESKATQIAAAFAQVWQQQVQIRFQVQSPVAEPQARSQPEAPVPPPVAPQPDPFASEPVAPPKVQPTATEPTTKPREPSSSAQSQPTEPAPEEPEPGPAPPAPSTQEARLPPSQIEQIVQSFAEEFGEVIEFKL